MSHILKVDLEKLQARYKNLVRKSKAHKNQIRGLQKNIEIWKSMTYNQADTINVQAKLIYELEKLKK